MVSFWSTFCYIFENGEIVKNSTACRRELNFQGLAGYAFVCFLLFFRVWFLDGFWDGFFMIWGCILGAFWTQKAPQMDSKNAPPNPPGAPQEPPQGATGTLQGPSRCSSAPWLPPRAPQTPKMEPKGVPRTPQTPKKEPKWRQNSPKIVNFANFQRK